MKLKCYTHNRRVMLLPSTNFVHRSDGTKCDTTSVLCGDQIMFKKTVMAFFDQPTYKEALEEDFISMARQDNQVL